MAEVVLRHGPRPHARGFVQTFGSEKIRIRDGTEEGRVLGSHLQGS